MGGNSPKEPHRPPQHLTRVGRESDPYEVTVGNAGPGLLNVAEVQLLGASPEHFTLISGSVSSSDFETGEAGYFSVKFNPQNPLRKRRHLQKWKPRHPCLQSKYLRIQLSKFARNTYS